MPATLNSGVWSWGRRASPVARRALARSSALFLVVVIIVAAPFAAETFLSSAGVSSSSATQTRVCDTALSDEMGLSAANLCLQNVQVSVSPSNTSEFSLPVMVMKASTTTTMDVLYLLGSETVGHTGPIQNVTASDVPVALSVPSGKTSDEVTFSHASVLFADRTIIVYRYTVTALVGSEGYYAVLPPYYYRTYPALAVGADPNHLNASVLSTWGYSGVMQSGEFALPSNIVGTGDTQVVNATIPIVLTCPNRACVIISHSGF